MFDLPWFCSIGTILLAPLGQLNIFHGKEIKLRRVGVHQSQFLFDHRCELVDSHVNVKGKVTGKAGAVGTVEADEDVLRGKLDETKCEEKTPRKKCGGK